MFKQSISESPFSLFVIIDAASSTSRVVQKYELSRSGLGLTLQNYWRKNLPVTRPCRLSHSNFFYFCLLHQRARSQFDWNIKLIRLNLERTKFERSFNWFQGFTYFFFRELVGKESKQPTFSTHNLFQISHIENIAAPLLLKKVVSRCVNKEIFCY